MLPAGNLNHRIVIEKPIKTTQPSGAIAIASWSAIHRRQVPASYQPTTGGESVRGVTMTSKTNAVFEIRYLAALAGSDATEHRLRWMTGVKDPTNAPVLNIVRVVDPDGTRQTMLIESSGSH